MMGFLKKNIVIFLLELFLFSTALANRDTSALSSDKKEYALTIGFMNGGGALIGLDVEVPLTQRFAFQAGFGLSAFGAGINYHLKPRLNSPYFCFSYWHQGINVHSQSLIGPSFVFRPKKILSAQLGLGYVLNTGPGLDSYLLEHNMDKNDYPPVVLTYSIGIYFLRKDKSGH